MYGATISYRREVGGHNILRTQPQEQIRGLVEDRAAGTLAPETATQLGAAQDKFAD